MFCTNCGKKIDGNGTLCPECQKNLEHKGRKIPFYLTNLFMNLLFWGSCVFSFIWGFCAFLLILVIVLFIIRLKKYPEYRKSAWIALGIEVISVLVIVVMICLIAGNTSSETGDATVAETENREIETDSQIVENNENNNITNSDELKKISEDKELYGADLAAGILKVFPEFATADACVDLEKLHEEHDASSDMSSFMKKYVNKQYDEITSDEIGNTSYDIYWHEGEGGIRYIDSIRGNTYENTTNKFIEIINQIDVLSMSESWRMVYLPSGELVGLGMGRNDNFTFCGVTYRDWKEEVEEKISEYFVNIEEDENLVCFTTDGFDEAEDRSYWKTEDGKYGLVLGYDEYGRLCYLAYSYAGKILNNEFFDEDNHASVEVLDYLSSLDSFISKYGESLPLMYGENAYSLGGESKIQYLGSENENEMVSIYLKDGYADILTIDGLSVGMTYKEAQNILDQDFTLYKDEGNQLFYLYNANRNYLLMIDFDRSSYNSWDKEKNILGSILFQNIDFNEGM